MSKFKWYRRLRRGWWFLCGDGKWKQHPALDELIVETECYPR